MSAPDTKADTNAAIDAFLNGAPHAVVGASQNRNKFGNMVLRSYMQNNRPVYPINPREPNIEGLTAYPSLLEVPTPIHGVSIITPPEITVTVIHQALSLGIKHLWLQPGAESPEAIALAREVNLISGGPCLLVVLGFPH